MLDCFIINKEDVAFTHGGYAVGKYNDDTCGLRLDNGTFVFLSSEFSSKGIYVKSGDSYFCAIRKFTFYI